MRTTRRTDGLTIGFRALVLVLLLCGTVGDALCQGAVRIRMMTYNIHHGATAGEEPSLAQIVDLIDELDVDVVALQEVDRHWSDRSSYADQACLLAEKLGMNLVPGAIYDLDPEEGRTQRRQYGLAILSRHPIASSNNFELTRLTTVSSEPERAVLPGFPSATLDLGGTQVTVFNTHLDYRADPAVREQQVAEMLDILSRFDPPVLVVGDFNAPPLADELRPLYSAYQDAWSVAGHGPGYTFPAADPTKRIDMIFASPDIAVDSVFVPVSAASDHRPVVADLTLYGR